MLHCFNIILFDLTVMDMQLERKCTTKYGNSFLEHISKSDLDIFTWPHFKIP